MEKSQDPVDRRHYDQLFTLDITLWETLQSADPQKLCSRCWVDFQPERGFFFPLLERICTIDPVRRTISFAIGNKTYDATFQESLVTLTYLAKASHMSPKGDMVTEKDIKGGMFFFKGPHALLTQPLVERFKDCPEEFIRRALELGGVKLDYGDASVKLRPLPKVPVCYIFYCGDDEFNASMKVTFDSTIEEHLPLDVIWALVNITSLILLDERK